MRSHFERFGEVTDVMVVYNRTAGVSRGFGFVTFKDRQVAEAVVSQQHRINNKSVEAKLAVQKGEQVRESFEEKMARQIFVGGLPPNTTSDQLKEWAQQLFGRDKVTNAIAVLDLETKTTRGFGFVNFLSPDMVDIAVQPGMVYELCDKRVEVKRAQAQIHHRGRGHFSPSSGRHGKGKGHRNSDYSGHRSKGEHGGKGKGSRRGSKKGHGVGKHSGAKGVGRWGPQQGYGKGGYKGYGRNEMGWEDTAQAYHHNLALQMQMQSLQSMPQLQMQGPQPSYVNAAMATNSGYGFPTQHPTGHMMMGAPPAMSGPAETNAQLHAHLGQAFQVEGDNPDTMFSPGGVMRFE